MYCNVCQWSHRSGLLFYFLYLCFCFIFLYIWISFNNIIWIEFGHCITASAEESGRAEQAYKGWLLLLVHAFICCRDCGSGCRHIFTDKISVTLPIANLYIFPRYLCVMCCAIGLNYWLMLEHCVWHFFFFNFLLLLCEWRCWVVKQLCKLCLSLWKWILCFSLKYCKCSTTYWCI